MIADVKDGVLVDGHGQLQHRPAALQRPVRRRRVLGDQERQEDADGDRLHLQRHHDRLLGQPRCRRSARGRGSTSAWTATRRGSRCSRIIRRTARRRASSAGSWSAPRYASGQSATGGSEDRNELLTRRDVKADHRQGPRTWRRPTPSRSRFSGGERSATRYANSTITANLIEHDQEVTDHGALRPEVGQRHDPPVRRRVAEADDRRRRRRWRSGGPTIPS